MTKLDPIEAVKQAAATGNRPAEYQDVINALKAIANDLRMIVPVLNATIDFLTLKMHADENQNAENGN